MRGRAASASSRQARRLDGRGGAKLGAAAQRTPRLQKYIKAKKGSGPAAAQTHPPSVEPQSEGAASVEPDVCADAVTADMPSPGKW